MAGLRIGGPPRLKLDACFADDLGLAPIGDRPAWLLPSAGPQPKKLAIGEAILLCLGPRMPEGRPRKLRAGCMREVVPDQAQPGALDAGRGDASLWV